MQRTLKAVEGGKGKIMYTQYLWIATVKLDKIPFKIESTEGGKEDEKKKNVISFSLNISVFFFYQKFFINISMGYTILTSYR